MLQHIRPALVMTAALCIITGLVYPTAVTIVANTIFPRQAQGSLIERNGTLIGSALIGQAFTSVRYFHGRPSAAGATGYDAMASGGSNKGPTDSALAARIAARVDSAVAAGGERGRIPADWVTTSASGLDPDISPASALLQASRVATARDMPPNVIVALVARETQARQFGLLGEPRVNVLRLNLALDSLNARSASLESPH